MMDSGCLNDDSFGPHVQGCRDDFDFTFRFEHIFLSILPASIFVAVSLTRSVILIRRPRVVGGNAFGLAKLVCFLPPLVFLMHSNCD